MKKSNILIAAFAILVSAAVSAKAGEIVDFDGKSAKTASFTEALGSAEAVKTDAIKFEKVAMEIPGRPAPEFTEQQVKEMDKSIGTAIAYVREQKLPAAFAGSFACLLQKGTSTQKAEFVYNTKSEPYVFPAICTSQNKFITDTICRWVTKKVCETVFENGTAKLVCTMLSGEVCF